MSKESFYQISTKLPEVLSNETTRLDNCRRLFDVCDLGRNTDDQTQQKRRRLFSRQSEFAVVGGWFERDGDAAFGDNAGRHNRTSLFGRNAVYPILLRLTAGDDNFMLDGRAVFSSRPSLYGLRIFGKTF